MNGRARGTRARVFGAGPNIRQSIQQVEHSKVTRWAERAVQQAKAVSLSWLKFVSWQTGQCSSTAKGTMPAGSGRNRSDKRLTPERCACVLPVVAASQNAIPMKLTWQPRRRWVWQKPQTRASLAWTSRRVTAQTKSSPETPSARLRQQRRRSYERWVHKMENQMAKYFQSRPICALPIQKSSAQIEC